MTERQVYRKYQQFLPEFDVTVNLVLEKLAVVYECFLEEEELYQDNKVIQKWLEQADSADGSNTSQRGYYKLVRFIIDDVLAETGVSYRNEDFLMRVKSECDTYGFEEQYENSSEIMVEETYYVRANLVDEIQLYIEYLDTCELRERVIR